MIRKALAWTFLPGKKGYPGILYIPGFVVTFIFMAPWLIVSIPYYAWRRYKIEKRVGRRAERTVRAIQNLSKEMQEEERGSEIRRTIDLLEDGEHNLN
jgi:hypothetical protein